MCGEQRLPPYDCGDASVSRIGFLTAVTSVAEAGDLRRFAIARQVMAYVGLVPSEFQRGIAASRRNHQEPATPISDMFLASPHITLDTDQRVKALPSAGRLARPKMSSHWQRVLNSHCIFDTATSLVVWGDPRPLCRGTGEALYRYAGSR